MTVPYLMNCAHEDKGWCLDCVEELGNENWDLRERLRSERDSLQISRHHLHWIYARLVNVHGENPDFDYMHRLAEIAGLKTRQEVK